MLSIMPAIKRNSGSSEFSPPKSSMRIRQSGIASGSSDRPVRKSGSAQCHQAKNINCNASSRLMASIAQLRQRSLYMLCSGSGRGWSGVTPRSCHKRPAVSYKEWIVRFPPISALLPTRPDGFGGPHPYSFTPSFRAPGRKASCGRGRVSWRLRSRPDLSRAASGLPLGRCRRLPGWRVGLRRVGR